LTMRSAAYSTSTTAMMPPTTSPATNIPPLLERSSVHLQRMAGQVRRHNEPDLGARTARTPCLGGAPRAHRYLTRTQGRQRSAMRRLRRFEAIGRRRAPNLDWCPSRVPVCRQLPTAAGCAQSPTRIACRS
jgi:hypothetical protein